SALENALPWDRIAPVRHRNYQELPSIISTLRERHQARVEHDPDFQYLEGELALAKEHDAANTVSLSEKIRLAERQRQREAELALENRRRSAKGLELLASVDELEKQHAADESEDAALVDDTSAQKDPADDILLTESGNILLDAIQLNRRVAASN
ncbi:MAG: carboxy terminal-processing peptidase, partial [Pseudomonadales bacterium]